MIYNLFPQFQIIHEGFSFYGLRKSDEVDTDLMYYFCWPYVHPNRGIVLFTYTQVLLRDSVRQTKL